VGRHTVAHHLRQTAVACAQSHPERHSTLSRETRCRYNWLSPPSSAAGAGKDPVSSVTVGCPLAQIPRVGFVAEDIIPQNATQTIQCCWPDNSWSHLLSTVQKFACGRGYLRVADVSSFCTLASGVGVQMISCTDNGRFLHLGGTMTTTI
jgi:hypothetical protein